MKNTENSWSTPKKELMSNCAEKLINQHLEQSNRWQGTGSSFHAEQKWELRKRDSLGLYYEKSQRLCRGSCLSYFLVVGREAQCKCRSRKNTLSQLCRQGQQVGGREVRRLQDCPELERSGAWTRHFSCHVATGDSWLRVRSLHNAVECADAQGTL